jgi:hypothetical protein
VEPENREPENPENRQKTGTGWTELHPKIETPPKPPGQYTQIPEDQTRTEKTEGQEKTVLGENTGHYTL